MIVKNEERILARCLASVKPYINTWCIVDTGSSDATMEVAREALSGIPGELHERPWVNFGHNRSEAFDLAKGKADYMLVIDADDELVVDGEDPFDGLSGPCYSFKIQHQNLEHYRAQLFRSDLPWRYEGALHEYATCGQDVYPTPLSHVSMRVNRDGARAQDRLRYAKDIELLSRELHKKPDDARTVFYLAQSYRDAGQYGLAARMYERRAALGGWAEEAYVAKVEEARCRAKLNEPREEILSRLMYAMAMRPHRGEAPCELATHCRLAGLYALAKSFAEMAAKSDPGADVLFVDKSVTDWRAFDELALAEYYTGNYQSSADICEMLLQGGKLPSSEVPRIAENLAFARAKLPQNRLSEVFGTWPGDETDEELLASLKEIG